jgi:hypothetical protein
MESPVAFGILKSLNDLGQDGLEKQRIYMPRSLEGHDSVHLNREGTENRMAHLVTEHGFVATGGGGTPVTNGYGTHSSTLITGVNVSGTQTGVVGSGPTGVLGLTSGTQPAGPGTPVGVQGQAADANGIGVQGQATGDQGIGVQGQGGVAGVEGDNVVHTGVLGTSVSGIGVLGESAGDIAQNPSISPYIGVYGQAQTVVTNPYEPPETDYFLTGVLGVGDRYGGVFQATPVEPGPNGGDPYANVQLSPVALPTPGQIAVEGDYAPGDQTAQLATKGMPGDIVAVPATDARDNSSVELWICIRGPATIDRRALGATWARIQFDKVVTMQSG